MYSWLASDENDKVNFYRNFAIEENRDEKMNQQKIKI